METGLGRWCLSRSGRIRFCDWRYERMESLIALFRFVQLIIFIFIFISNFSIIIQLIALAFGAGDPVCILYPDIVNRDVCECIEQGIGYGKVPCVCVVGIEVGSSFDFWGERYPAVVCVNEFDKFRDADLDLLLLALDVVRKGVLDVDRERGLERSLKVPREFHQSLQPLFDDGTSPCRYSARKCADHLGDAFFSGGGRHVLLELDHQSIEEFIRGFTQSSHHIVHVDIPEDTDGDDSARRQDGGSCRILHCNYCHAYNIYVSQIQKSNLPVRGDCDLLRFGFGFGFGFVDCEWCGKVDDDEMFVDSELCSGGGSMEP
jgi:hypothetical protein